MAATTHYDLLITATTSDAFVRARTLLWSINATALKALSLTEARAEELMRHLATPPARPWLLAHRYSEPAWAQSRDAIERQLLAAGSSAGWTAQVTSHAGAWRGACVLL